jgi:parvulin-like peptidyl-prolyl isomerase
MRKDMAKKEAQPSREPTRRQLALSRREQEQLRMIYLALGLVAILIIIVLTIGLVQTYVIEPNSPVAIVAGKEISTGAYRDRALYERFLLEEQIQQIIQQQAALPPPSENEDQFSQLLRNQYQQMANQLLQQRSIIDRQTVDAMIEEELIENEVAERGITVSEAEITEFINRILARRSGGLTAAAASETSTARADASATAAVWTPTPTFTPSPTLTATATITEPTATPVNTPTPAPTPTLNVITEDTLATQYSEWLETLEEEADLSEAEYREIIRKTILRDKLSEVIGDETPRRAEQAHARHILVETQEEAEQVIERLEAGEDFGALAEELSQDPSSATEGGDLDFLPRGRTVAPVDEAIFSLPIGQISEPIETQFGWHVIEVLEREERELSPADYSQQQQLAFSTWLENARQAAEIEDLWVASKAPPDPFFDR